MKKFLSVLVALVMVVALAAPALARNTAPNHSSGGLGVQRIGDVSITGNGNSARINVEAYGLDIQFPNRPANNQTNTFISDEGVKVTVFVRGNAILQGSATVECLCWNSTRSEVAPTCTTAGSYEYRCDVCGDVTDSGIIPAVGHIWGEWNVVRKACCQYEGYKYRLCQWSAYYNCYDYYKSPKLECECVPYVPFCLDGRITVRKHATGPDNSFKIDGIDVGTIRVNAPEVRVVDGVTVEITLQNRGDSDTQFVLADVTWRIVD